MATYTTILNAVVSQVTALGLTLGATTLPVALRKLPRAEETLDTLPLICVCPSDRPESVENFSSEDVVLVKYVVEVVSIAGGKRDLTGTNLDSYFGWREQVRRQFQGELNGVAAVINTTISLDSPLDRSKLNKNYDYSGMKLVFHTIESRTN